MTKIEIIYFNKYNILLTIYYNYKKRESTNISINYSEGGTPRSKVLGLIKLY